MWVVVLTVLWLSAAGDIKLQKDFVLESPEDCAPNVAFLLQNLPDSTGHYTITCDVKPGGHPA